jgi:hypothetical protein
MVSLYRSEVLSILHHVYFSFKCRCHYELFKNGARPVAQSRETIPLNRISPS